MWRMTLCANDESKLVIVTLFLNSLAASSIRLYREVKPKVGAITTNFKLSNAHDFLVSTILLDQDCVKKVLLLVKSTNTTAAIINGMIDQIWKINTEFKHPFTYYLYRASDSITQSHRCQFYSMFALYNFGRGRNLVFQVLHEIKSNAIVRDN